MIEKYLTSSKVLADNCLAMDAPNSDVFKEDAGKGPWKKPEKIDPKIPDTPKNEDEESTDDETPSETPSEPPTGKKDPTNPS